MQEYLLNSHYADVIVEKDNKLGIIIWKASCSDKEYKNAFNVLLEKQKQILLENFMSDIKNQGVVSPSSRKWFETYAMPTAIKQGLKKASVVLSANIFKKYYINVLLKHSKKFGLPMKAFSSEEDARRWLGIL